MKRIHLLLVCFLNFISTFAQFSGSGSGTESDPYKIYNADQLYQMRNFPSQEGVYFKLMANIDLTNWISENNPSQGWVPIGSEGESFRGVFDGNYKFITGLFINREKSSYVGLFGYTNNATINNLTLSGDIVGKSYTGAFIGCGYDTNINNCYFDGTATGKGDYVGGFCGFYNSSRTGSCTITQCKLKGTVSGVNYVGGVLGAFSNSYSSPNVDMCWVEGNVIGTGNYVGGICGQSIYFQGKKITNCGFSGIIKGVDYVGGISGESYIVISNCASIGKIYGSGNCVGGILGSGTRVYNSYSCGIIEGKESVGGIAGLVCADGLDCLVQYNYSNSNVKGANYVGGIVGKATKRNSQSSIAIQYNAALNSMLVVY